MLNCNAFKMLGEPDEAVLMFDKRNDTIGIKPAQPRATNAFPFKSKQKATYRIIHAVSFCTEYKIKPTRTIVFKDVDVDEDGILLLDLRTIREIGKISGQ